MSNTKQRYINTRFWNDTYISKLDPIEKLLFIYLLTNEHTNISGVYELPFKIMAIETGIDESMFKKILPRLRDRIRYVNGIVVIKNHLKHQETESPNVKKGIENCLKDLDVKFLKDIVDKGYYVLPKHYLNTLCIPYTEGRNYSNSNSNLDLHSIGDKSHKTSFSKEGAEILKSFEKVDPKNKTYYANKTQRKSADFLVSEYGLDKVISVIEALPKVNSQKLYIAQITTPYELQQNWVKLQNIIKQKMSENIKSKSNII